MQDDRWVDVEDVTLAGQFHPVFKVDALHFRLNLKHKKTLTESQLYISNCR